MIVQNMNNYSFRACLVNAKTKVAEQLLIPRPLAGPDAFSTPFGLTRYPELI